MVNTVILKTRVNGKHDGKMFTKHEPPTLEMYEDHLNGKNGLLLVLFRFVMMEQPHGDALTLMSIL